MATENESYIPASQSLPEFTLRAVLLGVFLSLIMCAANVYVGLYAGMTVSAAIPASVISMAVLRSTFRRGTILENNVVHTIASSGESLAAGIIFTVPAFVLLDLWQDYNFVETTLIAMAGGVMGVVMMIPLRRPMIIEQKELRYPEGVACAEVLKAGDRGGTEMLSIFVALAVGGLFKALVSVAGLFKETVAAAFRVGQTGFYIGTNISPMLMAVGFIVGFEISLLVFLGGAISYCLALPYLAYGTFAGQPADVAVSNVLMGIWDTKIRFFGIGAMIIAGLYSIVKIGPSIKAALQTALKGIRGKENTAALPRTEQGITGRALFALLLASLILSIIVYLLMTENVATTALISVFMFVLAFFFVAVASYIVGLVGSSNSPVSGMAICTILVTAGLLIVLGYSGNDGMMATLGVAGVVCCAACTSGDICQDLKIGQIVGATPRRLQTGEVIGTIIPAFIIAPTMYLLNHAYGIGRAVREDVAPLQAPQGVMFQKLVSGIFGTESIPWPLVGAGAAVSVIAIVVDRLFLEPRNRKFRLHAMPLAVGMYLPWTVTFPILLGGVAYLFVDWRTKRRGDSEETRKAVIHRGLLIGSGLVAGEAIMGILVALLVVVQMKMPWLPMEKWLPDTLWSALSLLALLGIAGLLIGYALKGGKKTST